MTEACVLATKQHEYDGPTSFTQQQVDTTEGPQQRLGFQRPWQLQERLGACSVQHMQKQLSMLRSAAVTDSFSRIELVLQGQSSAVNREIHTKSSCCLGPRQQLAFMSCYESSSTETVAIIGQREWDSRVPTQPCWQTRLPTTFGSQCC